MGKIKNVINKVVAWLNKAYQWLSLEGGMLHFLGFMCMMLTLQPFVGWVLASIISWIIFLGKEAIDFIRKKNNLRNVANDLIRDAIGWGSGSIVIIMQTI